jgi:hypothetical protein
MPELGEDITFEQLASHDSLKSLWIAVQGHGRRLIELLKSELNNFPVYDLTAFSSDHPGGIEALKSCAGTDGTESYEYAGHSESNMAKMQQYRVGRLGGSLEQASIVVGHPVPLRGKPIESAASRLKQPGIPRWTGLTATASILSLVVAISYQQREGFIDYSSLRISTTESHFKSILDANIGVAFWSGIAVASLASCVGMGCLYKLFISTLDYQNDVFSFPPTIPRKTHR